MNYVDFSELSVNAQRIFVFIERQMFINNVKEIKITKTEIAGNLVLSVANVKLGLRELKDKDYIIPKNDNSPIVKIGAQYEFRSIK